ncbi:polysaccharide biosynthesis/export family protein [Flocculibacter collagenilyticus]|uniref:polysaccharide biosynthesis/export family protein n=1 Tax=Flocculibacter collagenilyticus TaxID=2744479 RepID=UPI001F2DBD3A|nr:polysaccharide biosynthesis/export family protein [Flocculibacter collagenilyticus]
MFISNGVTLIQMLKQVCGVVLISFLLSVSTLSYADASNTEQFNSVEQEYTIGIGDRIQISVYNEPDLAYNNKIGKSGYIDYPLIGMIQVTGETPKSLSESLEHKLKDGYLVSPNVMVVIQEFRPFFIHGAVKRPGRYDFQSELTIEQAIAIAGGLKDRASKTNWSIKRENNKEAALAEKGTRVRPGDVITIEQSFF